MHVIAVDLGASNGRVMKCVYDGSFRLEEVNRFPNNPVRRGRYLHWNIQQLWRETVKGISWAREGAHSVGVDTWGVDFGLLDTQGNLLEDPVHYRDPRTMGVMEWVFQRISRREIFEKTGVQFLPVNTLYQLASLAMKRKEFLDKARWYLGVPDLFNYWLTGEKRCEHTHASTTQIFNPATQHWDQDILEAIGVPLEIFPDIIYPGSVLGAMKNISVSIPACHDTGSAVVAVPTSEADFAYLSSGTWSLMGTETRKPVINDKVYRYNFTNEAGAEKTNRLLKNLPGLWFEQELIREWTRKGSPVNHADLFTMAEEAQPFRSIIDPADPCFNAPGDMTPRIVKYCREHGEPAPQSIAEHIRCVYDSLALSYRHCLEQLEAITNRHYPIIHVVGGGSRNTFLNQLTAEVTGRKVVTGPAEAAILGNAAVQYSCIGVLDGVKEARRILKESLQLREHQPTGGVDWKNAYTRYLTLINHDNWADK